MRKIGYLLILWAASGLMACGGNSQVDGAQTHQDGKGAVTKKAGVYGEAITADNAMSIDEVVVEVTEDQPMKAKVKATVNEVCQKKGCWMTLNRADGKTMRVTFKDYGFFVPKDISGKEVIVEGVAKVEMTDVATLKHFAEDAGKSKEEIAAITEPEAEVVFEADGVIVL